MKVLGAYYPPGLIWQMAIVLPDGRAKIANHTPMRHLTEKDLRDMAALNNSAYRRAVLTRKTKSLTPFTACTAWRKSPRKIDAPARGPCTRAERTNDAPLLYFRREQRRPIIPVSGAPLHMQSFRNYVPWRHLTGAAGMKKLY